MHWGFGWMAAGICFLWNPLINVIDPLPDVLGWFFLALGMTKFSYLREDVAQARRKAWILCVVSAAKLLFMYWSAAGERRYPLAAEPTMVLTYALCFSIAEVMLGLSVLLPLLRNLDNFALLHDSKAVGRRIDRLQGLTVWFFILRAVGSMVPELVYLRSTEYLGNVVYGVVIDIRRFRPYLIVFCFAIVLIIGLVWMIRWLRCLRRIAKDSAFRTALEQTAEERKAEILCESTLERYRLAFGLLLTGGLFFCYLSLESVNVLPDVLGVLFTFCGVWILRRYQPLSQKLRGLALLAGVVSLPYWIFSVWCAVERRVFWSDNLIDYFRRNLVISAEKQTETMRLQLLVLLCSVIVCAVLIQYFRKLLLFLQSLDTLTTSDGVTLYDSMTKDMMKEERRNYEAQPKRLFVWFCITAGFDVVQNLPVFAFVVTPVALVRFAVNAIFLWKLRGFLAGKYKNLSYHYRYNEKKIEE